MKNSDLEKNGTFSFPVSGLSSSNGNVYVSTPRGTETLGEYGTFKHWQGKQLTGELMHPHELSVEFPANTQTGSETKEVIVHKSRAVGKTMPIAPNNQLLERLKQTIPQSDQCSVIMTTGNWVKRVEAEKEVVKNLVNPRHFVLDNTNRRNPLPSLEAINANIKLAWFTWHLAKRQHEQAMKAFAKELSRMSDFQLRAALNMLRVQAHSIFGKQTKPNPVATEKYLLALEETNGRRDKNATQRNAIDH